MMTASTKIAAFRDQKNRLNPEQRQAVETIEGPMMVLAGPGTGKTEVLALRIAEILSKTDTHPRSILALTFTESGVTVMRERLVQLIGPTAYAVAVYTYHGFANRVINESGAEFYKSHNLEQIDDIRQFKMIAGLLNTRQYKLLRQPRSPYYWVPTILKTIKILKNEAITPDNLRQKTRQAITSIEKNPDSLAKTGKNKGQFKTTVVTAIGQLQKTLELTNMYEAYEAMLVQTGRYDFEDMILFVLDKLRTNSELLAHYQERFLYFLVDEYQDTNNAQNAIIRILTKDVVSPNLFVVGDDKQSIYRFQGASTANIINFRSWYPDSKLVVLEQNYRSGQPILTTARSLISHNHTQLDVIYPELKINLKAQTDQASVQLTVYPSSDQELLGLVSSIANHLHEGIVPSQIAIIYRENREAQEIANLLAKQSIPYVLEAGTNVLEDSDVMQLINLIELTSNPQHDQAFFCYLHTPLSSVNTSDLLLFSRWHDRQDRSIYECLTNSKPDQLDINWDSMVQAKLNVESWYVYSSHHTVADIAEYILNQSGLLAHIIESNNHLERLNLIRSFYDDVKRLTIDEPNSNLKDLLERISLRRMYRLKLIASPLVETADGAIRLMTAHKSKGLEFDYVYIPNVVDGLWGNGRPHQSMMLPDELVTTHVVSEDDQLEEDRRLLYVAMTRAKSTLMLSYASYGSDGRALMPSQFLSELGDSLVTVHDSQSRSPAPFFVPIADQFYSENDRAKIQSIVTHQPLSPTSLNTYLTCPAEFLYKHIYRVPGVREPVQAYGTAIHRALEEWGKWRKGNLSFKTADVLKVFDTSLHDQGLVDHDRAEFSQLGHTVLASFLQSPGPKSPAPLAVEYSFGPHKVLLDGQVPIVGKLDVIEPISGSTKVRVVDYKTGHVRSRKEIEGTTKNSDGDYKRQLIFYTLLADSDASFPYTVGEVELRFIDDECKFTSEVFVINQDEKTDITNLLKHVYSEITALHFDHTEHQKRFGSQPSLCDILNPGKSGTGKLFEFKK